MNRIPIFLLIALSASCLAVSCKKKENPTAATPAPPTNTFTVSPTPTSTGYCGGAFSTCTFSSTPTDTPTSTPTPTSTTNPTMDPNAPIIVAYINDAGGVAVYVADSTGTTGTANTGVAVLSNGVTTSLDHYWGLQNTNIPAPIMIGPVTIGTGPSIPSILGAPNITGGLYTNNSSVTYTAGQTYTFNVVVDGTTYTASIVGDGGNPVIQPSDGSAGVTCSWTNGAGNKDYIGVYGPCLPVSPVLPGTPTPTPFPTINVPYIGPPIPYSPPYVVPNSLFTNEIPGSGIDCVELCVDQFYTSAFPSAQVSSCVISENCVWDSY